MTARLLVCAALAHACASTVTVKATSTGNFPRTWDDDTFWVPDLAATAPKPAPRTVIPPPPPPPPVRERAAPVAVAPAPNATIIAKPAQPAPKGLVVVLPIDGRDAHLDHGTYTALDEFIRTTAGDALSPQGYTVLTAETTLAVLSDNGVDATKACEASCALQTARELKAHLFVSGTVAKSEGAYIAFVRIFDSASGRQLASVSLEGDTVRALREAFAKRAESFFVKATEGL